MFRRTRPRGAVVGRSFCAKRAPAFAEEALADRSVLKFSMICPASTNRLSDLGLGEAFACALVGVRGAGH